MAHLSVMTEEENILRRRIADSEKRILEQEERIKLLRAQGTSANLAEEMLLVLRDSLRARYGQLDMLRLVDKMRNSPN